MSEGPQVRLRTAYLHRHLAGRPVIRARSPRDELDGAVGALNGRAIERCFCKGKHIFIAFEGGVHIHNHLLMRGRWRKYAGQLLIDPGQAWLSLYVGPHTLCNLNGQMLRLRTPAEVEDVVAGLGPDVMKEPYPREEIASVLRENPLPISEALLDQAVVCGLGNVARSEALFLAGIDPRTPGFLLADAQTERLLDAIYRVMWDSYRQGGRWTHRVYQATGRPCPSCGGPVRVVRLTPSRRNTFWCPRCQV